MGESDTESEGQVCPICKEEVEDNKESSMLYVKGASKINDSSGRRGRVDVVARPGQRVHKKCRKEWNDDKAIEMYLRGGQKKQSPIKKRSARISFGPYNSKTDCLFCGQNVVRGGHGHDVPACEVSTGVFPLKVLEHCNEREDDWGFIVKGRIEYFSNELHAADCIYHKICDSNFRTGRDIPEQFRAGPALKQRRVGRPPNEDQQQAFLRVCDYLETNDQEQLTISDLVNKMRSYLEDDSKPYGNQYLKEKLKGHYGDSLYIAEGTGLKDIVTMREKTSKILREYFRTAQSGDEDSQKRALIKTAAQLLKSDIKTSVPSVTDQYPPSQSLRLSPALDYIPASLRSLLSSVLVGVDKYEKVASIGHAIVQAARPRAVIAPLQIGLASQMHYLYKSRFLVDTLSTMGFCSSYAEVQRFQKNAAGVTAFNLLGILGIASPDMVLFAADNVDHNILTIDGKGTFHGMGMIAATTPGIQNNHVIPRKSVALLNVKEMAQVDIVDYRFSNYARRNIMFENLSQLSCILPPVDILWELSFCFRQQVPNWQGMMHTVYSRTKPAPDKSSITFLPMIDMYPGDPTCILSALMYICSLAERNNISPVITFDQPLFWKASEIIYNSAEDSPLRTITLMLGSFHTHMNLLGAIGTLMQGTGLMNIFEEIFGENAVKHIMTGKSVQRAFRGHLLLEKCLNGLIAKEVLDESDAKFTALVGECEETYNTLMAGKNVSEKFGNRAMVLLFGGKLTQTLASLRHDILKRKVVSATHFVTPERLPPTDSATKFHSLRCYHQIMTWTGIDNLNPKDWGWKSENNRYVPVMSEKPAAPEGLLKVVHCNCQTGCTTKRCSCQGYGLPCTSACGQCQVELCENPFKETTDVDSDPDDDENSA